MQLLYLTPEGIYLAKNGKSIHLPSYRAQHYQNTINEIQQGKAWKTTGRGAQFMGTAEDPTPHNASVTYGGLAAYEDGLLYTLQLDASGGLYKRSLSEKAEQEGHICSGNDIRLGDIAVHGSNTAACVRYPNGQSHLALFRLPSSVYTEITGGDSCELHPGWSPDGRLILFSTAGIARRGGEVAAYSPRSLASYNIHTECMDTILESESFDYLMPRMDEQDNLYCIRRPYKMAGEEDASLGSVLKDVLLFPYRLIKGLFGFLNVFTTLYGGEPLRNSGRRSDVKSKQKSEKDLFFEGNLIHAEKNRKENEKHGDPHAGILPRSSVLLRRTPDGTEEILARGVLDYTLCTDGSIVYSNGRYILQRHPDGSVTELMKEKLATRLNVLA